MVPIRYNFVDAPAICTSEEGSTTPELGFTQYFLGAVVLILKHTFRSDGFFSFIEEVTAEVKGPAHSNIYKFNKKENEEKVGTGT